MEATFSLTKRALLMNISRSLPKEHPYCSQPCLSTRAFFSTSFERSQDPRNRPPTEAGRDDDQRRHQGDDMTGVTGFVADTARQNTAKATEVAEDLLDLAKETTDTAWDSVKKTTQKISETLVAEADENVVDTTEYRSMEDLGRFADHDQNENKHHI